MDWFNENAGIMVLLLIVISVIAFIVLIVLAVSLRSRIAVQRLKMVGFYSRDVATQENYAEFTVGNRSLNDVGVKEIGVQNGKINRDLTAIYRTKANLTDGSRIVIDQRGSITFRMTEKELADYLLNTDKKRMLSRLRLYVVDLPGNVYYGKVSAVRKLLAEYLKRLKENGTPILPAAEKAEAPAEEAAPAAPAPVVPAPDVPAPDVPEVSAEAVSASEARSEGE